MLGGKWVSRLDQKWTNLLSVEINTTLGLLWNHSIFQKDELNRKKGTCRIVKNRNITRVVLHSLGSFRQFQQGWRAL